MKRKATTRERAKVRIRKKIFGADDRPRLSVYRSSKHTYAQVVVDGVSKTLVSASTTETEVKDEIKGVKVEEGANEIRSTKSVIAAKAVGRVLAKRVLAKGLSKVVFDRNGFIYHGRIKAVAEGAREGGLQF